MGAIIKALKFRLKPMKIINATPPADFPDQVIIMDREFAKRHPDKGFYLRVKVGDQDVKTVDLNGESTLPGAVAAARAKGHEPSHWMEVGGVVSALPSSIARNGA
jgi:hypothetical protein